MATILDTIVADKRLQVARLKKEGIHLPQGFSRETVPQKRPFTAGLVADDGVAIIAEVKKASPSKGVICADFRPVDIALNYEKNGASAISVLTDENFFQGSLHYMMEVRRASSLPVLRKDFIVDEIQIREAAAHGADAILLIVAILDPVELQEYLHQAKELGLEVLVEVHDEAETEIALKAKSPLLGVNNRNLKDFTVDINTTLRLKKMVGDETPVVSESGLSTAAHIAELRAHGVAAALVGESLMRAGENSDLLKAFRGVAHG